MDFNFSIFEHGEAHVEADLNLILFGPLVQNVLEVDFQVVQQIADGLTRPSDEEVVQPHGDNCLTRFPFTLFQHWSIISQPKTHTQLIQCTYKLIGRFFRRIGDDVIIDGL